VRQVAQLSRLLFLFLLGHQYRFEDVPITHDHNPIYILIGEIPLIKQRPRR
jgi:hypothetical protein